MNLNRRGFLATTTAALALPKALVASPNVLRAEPVQGQILPEGENTTAMLGFNGSSPGPALRVRQGEELAVRFENRIDAGSSVHWHGIRLENAMDGVPGLTQDLVQPGEDFEYRFRASDAGTYWYHSHNRSWEQVAKGLLWPADRRRNEPAPSGSRYHRHDGRLADRRRRHADGWLWGHA